MKVRLCCLLMLLALASIGDAGKAAGADTNAAIFGTNSAFLQTSPATDSSGDLLAVLIRLVGAFCLVVAILVFGAWFFKRSRFFALYQNGPAHLKVLESKSLGHRSSLLVVAYRDQRFLMAVSATGVNLLTSLPDDDSPVGPESNGRSFARQLGAFQEQKA